MKNKEEGLEILRQCYDDCSELLDDMRFLAGLYLNYDVSLGNNIMEFASRRLSNIFYAVVSYVKPLIELGSNEDIDKIMLSKDIDKFMLSKMLKWDLNKANKTKVYTLSEKREILCDVFEFPAELVGSTIEYVDEQTEKSAREEGKRIGKWIKEELTKHISDSNSPSQKGKHKYNGGTSYIDQAFKGLEREYRIDEEQIKRMIELWKGKGGKTL